MPPLWSSSELADDRFAARSMLFYYFTDERIDFDFPRNTKTPFSWQLEPGPRRNYQNTVSLQGRCSFISFVEERIHLIFPEIRKPFFVAVGAKSSSKLLAKDRFAARSIMLFYYFYDERINLIFREI